MVVVLAVVEHSPMPSHSLVVDNGEIDTGSSNTSTSSTVVVRSTYTTVRVVQLMTT